MAAQNSSFMMHLDMQKKADAGINKASAKRFLTDFGYRSYFMIAVFVCAVIGSVAFVKIPVYLGEIIDIFVSAIIASAIKGVADFDSQVIMKTLLSLAAAVIVNTLMTVLQSVIAIEISSKYCESLRSKAFGKLGKIEVSYVDIRSKNEVNNIFTSVIDELNQHISSFISQSLTSVILVVMILYYIFTIDVIFGAIAVAAVLFQILFSVLLPFFSGKDNGSKTQNTTDYTEIAENLITLKHSGVATKLLNAVEADEKSVAKKIRSARFLGGIGSATGEFFVSAATVAIIIFGAVRIINGDISAGLLISVVIFIKRIVTPLTQMTGIGGAFSAVLSTADKFFAFIAAKNEASGNKKVNKNFPRQQICFENISYRYPLSPSDVFEDFSLTLESKGITTLVGVTGVGKTTLLKLMLGFYTPQKGVVTLNGIPVTEINIKNYRDRFSVITQEATLFDCSIAENISYPKKDFDKNRADEIMKKLGAADFLSGLPDGYDTVFCSNPENLSGGQIQMILMARALYNNKKFIVLDEAFTNVDTKSENRLFDVLKEISKDHGVIIVSHKWINSEKVDNIVQIS